MSNLNAKNLTLFSNYSPFNKQENALNHTQQSIQHFQPSKEKISNILVKSPSSPVPLNHHFYTLQYNATKNYENC